jgi:hypothetical protein
VLTGYAVFAVGNFGIAYATRGRVPGQNALLDFNAGLLRFNILARLFPQALAAPGAAPLGVGTQATFLPGPAPIVTEQATGTTTTFGP